MTRLYRTMRNALIAAVAIAAVAGVLAGRANAETAWPNPEGRCTANQLVYGYDANNLTCGDQVPAFNSGTAITRFKVLTAAIVNFALAAQTCVVKEYSVSGLTTADKVFLNPTYLAKEAILANAWVSASGTLEITFCNPHTVTVDPEAGTVNVTAIRS